MAKHYSAFDLIKEIQSSVTIVCDVVGCTCEQTLRYIDKDQAADVFFERGWRVTIGNRVHCPKHAKDKLKA